MTKPTTTPAGRARFALVAALYKQQLGEVIRGRREALGLTQKELADRANVEEPQTVSRWERGLNAPTDLESVARALETTADEMLRQLRPLNQKERQRLVPEGGSQLDRIEALLQEILSRLEPETLDEVLEGEADRLDEQPEQTAAGSTRSRRSRSAS